MNTVNGLPAHVLLLHVVVVLVPIAAAMLVVSAAWPAARARLGAATPVVAFVALAFVPLTSHAGEWLRARIDPQFQNAQITRHANLGPTLLPWAAGVFVLAAVGWWLDRRATRGAAAPAEYDPPVPLRGPGATGTLTQPQVRTAPAATAVPAWQRIVLLVLSVVVGAGAVIQLYRIGDSGAHAAWDYVNKLPAR